MKAKRIHSPRVFVVTPVFNRISLTLRFLESIQQSDYNNLSVIIVDDGSTDGTTEEVRRIHPDVTVLTSQGELWWAGATNLGVEHALKSASDDDYILTINNDTTVEKHCVSRLVNTAKQNKSALVGAIVRDQKKHEFVWYYGGKFDRSRGILEHNHGVLPEEAQIREADWLTGMGTLLPVTVFKQLGLYDNRHYPQYFGDTALSLEAHRNGYQLIIDTDAEIYADLESAWINSDLVNKPWSFIWEVFFSVRSAFRISGLFHLYSKYWGKGWRVAFLKVNYQTLRAIVFPFVKQKIKKQWVRNE